MALASVICGGDPLGTYKFGDLPRPGDVIEIPVHGTLYEMRVEKVRFPGVYYGNGFHSHGIGFVGVSTPRDPELLCERTAEIGPSSAEEVSFQRRARGNTNP